MPEDYQWLQQFHLQQEETRKRRELSDARRRDNARKTIKKYNTGSNKGRARATNAKGVQGEAKKMAQLLESMTPWGIFSLMLQFNPAIDWMYGLAFFAAIGKDILNYTEATGVLYALVFIATILVSIFIGMMVLLSGLSEGRTNSRSEQKMIRALLILTFTTAVEIIPGVNFIPFETISVMVLYAFALQERKQLEKFYELAQQKIAGQNQEEASGAFAEA